AFKPQGRRIKVPSAHRYVQSLMVNDHTKQIDKLVHSEQPLEVETLAQPLVDQIQRPTDCPYPEGLPAQWAANNDRQIESLGEFLADTLRGETRQAEPLRQTCAEILKQLQEDPDALVCLAGAPHESEYPSRHGIHLASMAMAIGVEMGLDEPNLIDLGIGCLVHDIGMRKIGLELFQGKDSITREQLRRLADHPVHAVAIAGEFGEDVSVQSRIVAYQLHERLDGSGYPRGRSMGQIHSLARVAAVADAFVGMLSPRPHRLAIQGHYALQYLLQETKDGKFDPQVIRALLRVTSLYPIGSCVGLNNNHVGRVIRTGGADYDKPTIEMWPADDLQSEPTIVNLKEEPSVRIERSIPHFDAA
ncbi:MAG: HD domain-containing protein, partial [Pirellulales bacterium]|nr:HD domain-containing protein [Pirellulales bacterium]